MRLACGIGTATAAWLFWPAACLVVLAVPGPCGTHGIPGSELEFVRNVGQWPEEVLYLVQAPTLRARVERDALGLDLVVPSRSEQEYVRLRFVEPAESVEITPLGGRTSSRHYYQGPDESAWFTDVPAWSGVGWLGVQPGVDVLLGESSGTVAYTIRCESRAALHRLEFELEGVDDVVLESDGAWTAETAIGTLHHTAPRAWFEGAASAKIPVGVQVVRRGPARFGFTVGGDGEDLPLVIDPGLSFSSFLGGTFEDEIRDVRVDDEGRLVLAGYTQSSDFPSIPGPYQWSGGGDAFIARVSADGSGLDHIAYIGGSSEDRLYAMDQGDNGRVYVTGWTTSSDFPTTPGAYDSSYGEVGEDGFVACLRADGSQLVYSTYLGGHDAFDLLKGICVSPSGKATVVGRTISDDFPTTPGAYQTPPVKYAWDGTVTQLSPDGTSLVFSTLLGGLFSQDDFLDVALDELGNVYVVGGQVGESYPKTPGAFPAVEIGASLSKLNASGTQLLASTVIGGNGSTTLFAVEVASDGSVYIAGRSAAANYPVTEGAFDTDKAFGSEQDIIVTRFDSDLSSILASTYLGTEFSSTQAAFDMYVDASGVPTITGTMAGTGLQTTAGSLEPTPAVSNRKSFVSRFDPSLEKLLYSSFLSGGIPTVTHTAITEGFGIYQLDDGSPVVVGWTTTVDYATTPGAPQPLHAGDWDAFVTVLDALPTGVDRFGESTASCNGPIWIGVTEQPVAGSSTFGLTSSGSPPDSVGVLALGGASVPVGFPILGVLALLDPLAIANLSVVTSDHLGWCEQSFVLPASSQGKTGYFQFLWFNTAVCGGLGTFSASNALEVTVQ